MKNVVIIALIMSFLAVCPSLAGESRQWEDAYRSNLADKLNKAWIVHSKQGSNNCIVRFSIGATGELQNVQIEKPSKVKGDDQYALSAVKSVFPFRPLPNQISAPIIMKAKFAYRYDSQGQENRVVWVIGLGDSSDVGTGDMKFIMSAR